MARTLGRFPDNHRRCGLEDDHQYRDGLEDDHQHQDGQQLQKLRFKTVPKKGNFDKCLEVSIIS